MTEQSSTSNQGPIFRVYIDRNDWWIGVYRGPHHWYICPLPCVVLRVSNRQTRANLHRARAGWPGGIEHG